MRSYRVITWRGSSGLIEFTGMWANRPFNPGWYWVWMSAINSFEMVYLNEQLQYQKADSYATWVSWEFYKMPMKVLWLGPLPYPESPTEEESK